MYNFGTLISTINIFVDRSCRVFLLNIGTRDSSTQIFSGLFLYIYIFYLDARQMYTMLFLAGLKACIEYHLTIKAVTASGLIGDMSTQRYPELGTRHCPR